MMLLFKFLTLFLLLVSSLLILSSNNWFMFWVGLELNLMVFLSLLVESGNQISFETTLKYFLIQASMSLMLIFLFVEGGAVKSFLAVVLSMKLGLVPFHFWFIKMNQMLSYWISFLFITWQKLAPLFLLMLWIKLEYMVIFLMMMFFLLVNNLNQVKFNNIISYSSSFHLIWMLMNMLINLVVFVKYYIIYTFMMFYLLMSMKYLNFIYIMKSSNNMKSEIFIVMILLISLAGLPPMLGFMLKWLTIMNLMKMKLFMFIIIMLMLSSLNFYIYMRLVFNKIMNSAMSLYMKKKLFMKYTMLSWSMLTFVGLMVAV